jgi:acyl-CoA synthetase (NDP forming)
MSAHGVPEPLAPVPSFAFPERAVAALARAANYAEWRRRPEKDAVPLMLDETTLRNVVNNAIERGGGWLDPAEVDRILRAAGINAPGGEIATDADEAFEAAMRIGQPVALKQSARSCSTRATAAASASDCRTNATPATPSSK